MTTINLPRATVEQALEAMRRAVPTGKITLYEWDKAMAELDAALAQQAEQQPMHPELRKMWEDHFDKCFRAIPVPEQAEPVQMHPSQFAEMIKGKEALTGIPVYWAEWPNKEES